MANYMGRKVKKAWLQGYLEGLEAYAWWKDGEEFVGTSGKTLKQAVSQAKEDFPVGDEPDLNPTVAELLAACKGILAAIEDSSDPDKIIDENYAAIDEAYTAVRKAQGGDF